MVKIRSSGIQTASPSCDLSFPSRIGRLGWGREPPTIPSAASSAAAEGRGAGGACPGRVPGGPSFPRLCRDARGRRWARAATGVAEQQRRRSLPHRARRRPAAAAPTARRAAGQSGMPPTLPRPSGGSGRWVGLRPGRRRGALMKGPGRRLGFR